ncbi:MAG TPA: hypothetical protein VF916_10570 [Ktedonobacterales bacterium]
MREPAAPAGGAIAGRHYPPADALVVLVKTLADFDRVRTQQWYRLPLEKAPPPLLGGHIRQIAF